MARDPRKTKWIKKIKKATEEAGTYKPFFDDVIDILADILVKRDEAEVEYKAMNSKVVIDSKGATVKNPALLMWDELNKSALAYWRDLGLTPAGLKKINEDALKSKPKSALAQALADIGG